MTNETESTKQTREAVASLVAGLLFGAGLVVSGMTDPGKVIAFLDFTHGWDPSLMFVMAGAIGVHATVFRVVRGRKSPLLAERWSLPTRRDIEPRLVLGAAIFGVGWGLGGYCPGPGLVSVVGGGVASLVFVFAMLAGMAITGRLEAPKHTHAAHPSDEGPLAGHADGHPG